jgi:hypothetical protein
MARPTYFGSKKLNAEEAVLFQSLKDDSFFSGWPFHADLEQTKLELQKKKEKELVQPYADLLLAHIKSAVTARRGEIWETLAATGECEVFSYEALHYNQDLVDKKRRLAEMSAEEREAVFTAEEPTETHFGLKKWHANDAEAVAEGDDLFYQSHELYPIKVQRIFRSSDLGVRISLLFGPHFFIKKERKCLERKEGNFGWTHQKVTIKVVFKGESISEWEAREILRVAKETKQREVRKLELFEWVTLDGEAEFIPAPPCGPQVRAFQ